MNIKVYFDYVCPFCYIQKEALTRLQEKLDIEVEYIPYELRRFPTPKVDPMNDEAKCIRFKEVLKPEADALGIEMKLPWISPHPYTTDTFLGFLYAKENNMQAKYNHAIYHAFYILEKDVGDKAVIQDIIESLGLCKEGLNKALNCNENKKYLDLLFENKKSLGINGIPCIEINDKKYSGYKNIEQLEELLLENYQDTMHAMTCGIDGCE